MRYLLPLIVVPAIIVPMLLVSVMPGQTPGGLLEPKDSGDLATRTVQLIESTAFAVPGLIQASEAVKRNATATAAALQRAPLNAALTYQLINQVKAYLALSDSIPPPSPLPAAAEQQNKELGEDLRRLQLHFEAILQMQNQQAAVVNPDPNDLKHYADADLKMPPSARGQRVVFLGDSITEGWRLNEYFPSRELVNRGISGQTTTQILARFRQDVVALSPRALLILAGTNDLSGSVALNQIEDNLSLMGDLAKAYNMRVGIASITPVSDYHKDVDPRFAMTATHPLANIQALNRWVESKCKAEGFVYVNYYAALVDASGQLQADLSDDGLHPNTKGYRVMSPVAEEAVKALLTAVPDESQSRRRFRLLGK